MSRDHRFSIPFACHEINSFIFDDEHIRKNVLLCDIFFEWGILSQSVVIHFPDLHIRISASNITVTGRTSMEMTSQSPVSNLQRESAQLIPVWRCLLLWPIILNALQFNWCLSNGHTAWTITWEPFLPVHLVMTFKDSELPFQGLEMQGTGEMSVYWIKWKCNGNHTVPPTEPI